MRSSPSARLLVGLLVTVLLLGNVLVVPPSSRARGVALASASLNVPRADHTATLLPDGQVLVVGGHGDAKSGDRALNSAETYNTATNAWTRTRPLATPRTGHTATLLPDGRVLVVGGRDGDLKSGKALSSVEIYDPKTNTWTGAASLATPRMDQTATLLPDGKVLVTGGYDTSSGKPVAARSAELYDPRTNTWTGAGSLGAGRANQSAALLPDGRVLVAGGQTTNGDALSSTEAYNPTTNSWTGAASLSTARAKFTTTALPDGRVLAVGGEPTTCYATAELFDPTTNTWASAGTLSSPRQKHTASLLPDGRVMIVGGDFTPPDQYTALADGATNSTIDLFDPTQDTFTLGGEIPGGVSGHTATVLPNGQVLIVGGVDSTGNVLGTSLSVTPPPATSSPTAVPPTTVPPTVAPRQVAPTLPPPTATQPPPTQGAPTATTVPPTPTQPPPAATQPALAPLPTATATPPPPPPAPTATSLPTATPVLVGTISGQVAYCESTTGSCPAGSTTPAVGASVSTSLGHSTTVEHSGSYVLSGVPANQSVRVTATYNGVSQSQTVTVPPGGNATADFVIVFFVKPTPTPAMSAASEMNRGSRVDRAGAQQSLSDVAARAQVTTLVGTRASGPVACAPTSAPPPAGAMPHSGGGGGQWRQRDPLVSAAVLALAVLALGAGVAATRRRPQRRRMVARPSAPPDRAVSLLFLEHHPNHDRRSR